MSNLVLLILFVFPVVLQSQNEKFPEEWQGKWEGELEIYQNSNLLQKMPMSLDIQVIDTNSWTFYITYGKGEQEQFRPYELEVVDELSGHYRIDERNGIFLDAYLHGNCLYERFSVGGSMLTNRLCNFNDTLYYEITVGAIEAISTTGGDIINEDTIPQVKSYGIPSIQKAKLQRTN